MEILAAENVCCPDEDDNWALVSDDSEHYPVSSLVGVAGMVAEWLWLYERLIFQQVSQIISFQFKMELGRGVWDSLDADTWTLLSSEWEQYC